MGPTHPWECLCDKEEVRWQRQRHKTKITPFVKKKGFAHYQKGKKGSKFKFQVEPSIWAEPVGPARFCLSPVGPGLGFRGKNRGVGPEGPALKG